MMIYPSTILHLSQPHLWGSFFQFFVFFSGFIFSTSNIRIKKKSKRRKNSEGKMYEIKKRQKKENKQKNPPYHTHKTTHGTREFGKYNIFHQLIKRRKNLQIGKWKKKEKNKKKKRRKSEKSLRTAFSFVFLSAPGGEEEEWRWRRWLLCLVLFCVVAAAGKIRKKLFPP